MSISLSTPKNLWAVLAASSTVGLLASFIQTIERINYARSPQVPLTCDLNSIFSCSNVFDAWQSSVFGFSNSLMCIVFFAVTLGVALTGMTASKIQQTLRLIMHFFSVFFLGFGAWYLWQSTYRIGYVCIFCLICYASVITINWAWLRMNATNLPLKHKARKKMQKFINDGADTFFWALWTVVIAAMIIWHFW